jgi:cation transport regulator
MRYASKSDLPPTVRNVLPEPAQELYLEAYNQGWDQYKEGQGYLSRDGVAHQRGWTAVRHVYVQDQGTGKWHRIGQAAAEREMHRGFVDILRSLFSRKQ